MTPTGRLFTKPPAMQHRPEEFAAMRAAFQSLLPSVEEMHTRLKTVFTTQYPTLKERTDTIEAKARAMHPDGIYRDLIYDELLQDPTRTDDDIATDIAIRCAFP